MKAARALLAAALVLALSLAGLELALRAAGAVAVWRQRRARPEDGVVRVLCLGESTTYGAQVAYPAELEKLLNADGRRFQVINEGVPGINSNEILRRLDGNLDRYRPQVVVAMMGANDPGTPWALALARSGGLSSWRAVRLARLLASGFFKRPSPVEVLAARERAADALTPLKDRGWRALAEKRPLAAAFSFYLARRRGSETARIGLAACAAYFGLTRVTGTLAWSVDDLWDGEVYMRIAHGLENEQRRADAHRVVVKALAAFAERRRAYKTIEELLAARGETHLSRAMGNVAVFTRQMGSRALWELGGTCRALKHDDDCLPQFRMAVAEADAAEAEGSARYDLEEGGRKRPDTVFYTKRGSAGIRAETRHHLAVFLAEFGKKRAREALETSRAAFELDPTSEDSAALYSRLLRERGRPAEAEAVLERSLALSPEHPRRLLRLAVLEESLGHAARAKDLREKAALASRRRGPTMTEVNYLRLAEALAARDIPLVCVAYPRARADALREALAGRSGVFFVDNDRGFAEQIAKSGVDSVFVDLFGGSFGHCTALGYRILARNVEDGVRAAAGTL